MNAAVINRLPAGFLGLLDLKTMGKNPNRIGDAVLPTVDMFEHYIQSALQWHTPSSLTASLLGVVPFTSLYFTAPASSLPVNAAGEIAVPDDEIWYCNSAFVAVNFGAIGDRMFGGMGFRPAGTLGARCFVDSTQLGVTTAVAVNDRFAMVSTRPYWMRGGDRLYWTPFSANITVATTYAGTFQIARFAV